MVRQHGGLDPLVAIIKDEEVHLNKPLLAAATGAIWKCAISIENVRRLDDLNTVNILVNLLGDEDEEVPKCGMRFILHKSPLNQLFVCGICYLTCININSGNTELNISSRYIIVFKH